MDIYDWLDNAGLVFYIVLGLVCILYVSFQILAIRRLRRGMRLASLLPIPFVIGVLAWSIVEFIKYETYEIFWLGLLLLTSAAGAYYLFILLLAHRLTPAVYRSVAPHRCPTCEYDCRGMRENRCPECGGPLHRRADIGSPDPG